MGHSWPLFLYFRLFYKQLTGNLSSLKFADGWIRTTDLWCRNRPLCQLSHNHCPSSFVCSSQSLVSAYLSLFSLNGLILKAWNRNESKMWMTRSKEKRERERYSATRFGEISLMWQQFKILWQLLESLLNIWQNLKPPLETFQCYWPHFHCSKLANIGK